MLAENLKHTKPSTGVLPDNCLDQEITSKIPVNE
jgi:hypothetical protein